MGIAEVHSGDGTPIVYRAFGAAYSRALVMLHGWSASMRCWPEAVIEQLAAHYRVITVDLRGHGYSGAPEAGYDDPANWAGDVAAVLEAERITAGAVLLGWSYGGLVACDYLAADGTGAVGGLVLAGAITGIGRGQDGGRIGAAMRAAIPDVYSTRAGVALRAFTGFGDANTGRGPGTGELAQRMLGTSLATPPRVRQALFERECGHAGLLRELDIPALILHGDADPVVDVSVAESNAAAIPDARLSIWPGVKHGPFVEDPDRFAAEVIEFGMGLR